MEEPDPRERLQALNAAIAAVARADEPYWAANELCGLASSMMTELGIAYRLYLMWSYLTDWYELKPAAREAYLDRWMFDVLGLDRNIGREF